MTSIIRAKYAESLVWRQISAAQNVKKNILNSKNQNPMEQEYAEIAKMKFYYPHHIYTAVKNAILNIKSILTLKK